MREFTPVDDYLPEPYEFGEEPDRWKERYSTKGEWRARPRAEVDARLWLKEHGGTVHSDICPEIRRTVARHQKALRKIADAGGIHQAMTDGVWAVIGDVQSGHSGGVAALKAFKDTFMTQVSEVGRREQDVAEKEWARACIGAIEKTAIESVRLGDPCEIEEDERGEGSDRFFDKHGLKALTLKLAVEKAGALCVGPGDCIYRWADGIWSPDGDREVKRRVSVLLRDRYRPSHHTNVVSQVTAEEPSITDETQDANLEYLNLPNGLLEWETGTIHPHSHHIKTTVRVPISWDEDADCPEVDSFLEAIFLGDRSLVELAYETLGYMLYNDNPLHKAILLYGTGRNGKSTFLRVARMLVGHRNYTAVTPQSLDSDRFAAAQLHNKLANLVGDVDPRIFKSTEVFKQLTGGDEIMAQHKYGQPFTFRCRALMVAAFNALPRTRDTTEGFFSRWIVVPFNAYFPANIADPNLIDRLTSTREMQGLLVKSVQGLQSLMERGSFKESKAIRAANRTFRMQADPIRSFIDDCVAEPGYNPNSYTSNSDIYEAYETWCDMNGHYRKARNAFIEEFKGALQDVYDTPLDYLTSVRRGQRGFRIDINEPE